MKKLVISIASLLLTLSLLASCNGNTDIATEPPCTSTTGTTSRSLQYFRSIADDFLTSLKNGETEKIIKFLNINAVGAYDFLKNVQIESYNITGENEIADSAVRYKVELSVAKSGTLLFSTGKSLWDLEVRGHDIALFQPSDGINGRDFPICPDEKEALFCERFSTILNYFDTANDFNTIVPDPADRTLYNSFCHNLTAFLLDDLPSESEGGKILAKDVQKTAKKILGITSLDLTKFDAYKAEDNTITLNDRGFPGYVGALSFKAKGKQEKEWIVIIDYYTDSAQLLKGRTVEYTVRENDDGSFTLLSTRKTYDSGYALATLNR